MFVDLFATSLCLIIIMTQMAKTLNAAPVAESNLYSRHRFAGVSFLSHIYFSHQILILPFFLLIFQYKDRCTFLSANC